MQSDAPKTRRFRARRIVFAGVIAASVFALCELVAFVGLSLAAREVVTPSELSARRMAAANAGSGLVGGDEQVATGKWYPQHAVHPYLGFVLDSKFRTAPRLEMGGEEALSYGFELAQPGLFYPPADDRLIVGVIGGSLAFNFARNTALELRSRLASELGFIPERVIIVDIALPGFKQPQQLMTVNYLLSLGAHFDVLVNIDGYNEIALPPLENLPHGVDASYPRRWHLRVGDLDPQTRLQMAELARLARDRFELTLSFDRWPLRASYVAGLVWSVFDRRLEREATEIESGLATAENDGARGYSATGPARTYESRLEMLTDLKATWARSSRLINGLCSTSGILYLHVLQPNQYLPGSKSMGRDERDVAYLEKSLYGAMVKRGYPLMIEEGEALRSDGVRFLDLSMLFADVEEPIYVDTCCHINTLGEAMLADAIIDAIVAEYRRD